MKGIFFQIDEETYKAVKIEMVKKGVSLREYFTELIKKELANKDTKKE